MKSFPKDDGYRGIWFTLGQVDAYGDKYSGGLGTYTAKHVPLAVYAPQVDKTFFVYGGGRQGQRHLLAMASYYDHRRHRVPRPTIVHDKQGVDDPHDNPSICLDEAGHVWVFVSGRGRRRPGYKYRSLEPFSVDGFERVSEEEMTYPQPWWIEGQGFLHLFTKYTGVRELYWNRSVDGRVWTAHRKLAGMGGHYQTSRQIGGRVITAFNMHPDGNVDRRTNLYFAQTDDLGQTWCNAAGQVLETPLQDPQCAALVRDFAADRQLVYMKDITVDAQGRPVILVVVSADYRSGPGGDPRWWTLAHWQGNAWSFKRITTSTHNYDMGSLYIEPDGNWRLLAPTAAGPQYHGTGGEMVLWGSTDQGRTWQQQRQLTRNSPFNHAYARRPVNAHDDFYALWADGHADGFSVSRLYFCNKAGDRIWRLPYYMPAAEMAPLAYQVPG